MHGLEQQCWWQKGKAAATYIILEPGNKAWKVQVGKIMVILSRGCLKPHLGRVDPLGRCTVETREAEDGLCSLYGFDFFGNKEPRWEILGEI